MQLENPGFQLENFVFQLDKLNYQVERLNYQPGNPQDLPFDFSRGIGGIWMRYVVMLASCLCAMKWDAISLPGLYDKFYKIKGNISFAGLLDIYTFSIGFQQDNFLTQLLPMSEAKGSQQVPTRFK